MAAKIDFCRGWDPRPCASVNQRQNGWGPHQRGWSDDACATLQRRPRHELVWIWTDCIREQVWQRASRMAAGSTKGQEGRRKRQPVRCSCKTQDKFAIVSMQKLLHRCIGAHARVHMHLLRRVWMHSQELLSTMHAQVCTLDRCCEHQPKHLLYARYRMCICDRYWDIYVYVYIRWTGSTIRQGDEHRAVGGKGKMPHEMLQQDSKSWPSGSRFWWNLEKYLSLDFWFRESNPSRTGRTQILTAMRNCHQIWWQFRLAVSIRVRTADLMKVSPSG